MPARVKLDTPLVVSADQSNALDLEFGLSRAAFIVGHATAAGTVWVPLPSDPTKVSLHLAHHTVGRAAALELEYPHRRTFFSKPSRAMEFTAVKA